jgi:lysophospholipase L1-like esterase
VLGRETADVVAEQLHSLSRNTTLVTISIGGNDVGFAGAIRSCLLGGQDRCDSAIDEGETEAREQLPAKLDATYAEIASAAPNAKVVVVGYPRVNELGDCGIPGFDDQKRRRINHGSDVLAGVLSERAAAAGFAFADARGAFDGHGVCAADEWINGPSNPLRESFHPNADGHASGYLPAINAITG